MCELYAVTAAHPIILTHAIKRAIRAAEKNNPHGSGVWLPELGIIKGVKGEAKQLEINTRAVIAHARLSTCGKIVKENAHPFESSGFVWAHNGIIRNAHALAEATPEGDNIVVDSEIIGRLIAQELEDGADVTAAISKAMGKLGGSYSVLIAEKKTARVFYVKNGSTQINAVVGWTKDGNTTAVVGTDEATTRAICEEIAKPLIPVIALTEGVVWELTGGRITTRCAVVEEKSKLSGNEKDSPTLKVAAASFLDDATGTQTFNATEEETEENGELYKEELREFGRWDY